MLSKSICKGFNDGIEPFGSERRHVEDGANGFSSAADGAFSLVRAAITIEGSQADEGGDLLAVQFAEFRNIGDHGGGGNRPEAGNRLDELGFIAPVIVGLDEGLDGAFDVVDLPLERIEDGLDTFSGELGFGDLPAIGLLGSEVDELPPAGDELLDFGLFFRSFLDGDGLHLFGEERQDTGIDAIGLGHQAQRPSEVAGPFGIDDGDGKPASARSATTSRS